MSNLLKVEKRGLISKLLLSTTAFLMLSSCSITIDPTNSSSELTTSSNNNSSSIIADTEEFDTGLFTEEDFIKTSGYKLRKNYGKGDELTLKGINAGGYLVIEGWMCALRGLNGRNLDHKNVTEVFTERFGKEETLNLWEYYRSKFWQDVDFENIYDMKMNCIRLPFSYMSVDPRYNNVREKPGQKYNFDILDNFVSTAAQYGIYTILDMHGAPGSQNGQDHSGEVINNKEDVDFYSNEEKIQETINIWTELAKHFEGNPCVAGYDILNEPGEKAGTTGTKHFNVYDRIYDAIREQDEDHVIIMESCWDAANLPMPSEYQWSNVMYSFHHYTNDSNADSHVQSHEAKVKACEDAEFNVPLQMGEFNCYGNEESWNRTLALYNRYKWSWNSWAYKVNRNPGDDSKYPGWGTYYTHIDKVSADNDSIEEIKTKWAALATDAETTKPMTFDSGNTLAKVYRSNCL